MKAILEYGSFTKEIEVNDYRQVIYIPKPPAKLTMVENDMETPVDITANKLEFYLKEAPRLGVPLRYEFVGES